jgi:hypothetical protein
MVMQFKKHEVALAAMAVIGTLSMAVSIDSASAAGTGKTSGQYVAGDFHNHTTCSDGSLSMQKLVKKATQVGAGTWGLDWFVQAGHGGNGNRNCTLTEDASLGTPNFPFTNQGPTTTWANSVGSAALKGDGAAGSGNMWRWQSLQSFQYQVIEDQAVRSSVPLFLGMESVVAGHEHTSMSIITGQMPGAIDALTNSVSVNPTLGNADALAQWSYCFDRGDTDLSRGTTNQWSCSFTGSTLSGNSGSAATVGTPWWSATGQKLVPVGVTGATVTSGNGVGDRGHQKTVEAVQWMAANHPTGSYYIPAHLERAGPFNPLGNNGFNVEHLRNFNNAGSNIAFGMESQPGHGASANRGEYQIGRQTINGVSTDSVGGTTYGGTGVYAGLIGGVWDAMLGEGRNFWFFASSDWHNRGVFGPDDRRSTQDFQPGEYQRNYTMVKPISGTDSKLRPQNIVDGLRSGNNWATQGQLIDRLAFVACSSATYTAAQVQALAVAAANSNAAVTAADCANMGEKLKLTAPVDVIVAIVLRDPSGANNSPYAFPNPSLLQGKAPGTVVPNINEPVLDHVDLIGGDVSGYITPGSANYSGAWPTNTAWLSTTGSTPVRSSVTFLYPGVPAGAQNPTAKLLTTFSATTSVTVGGQPAFAVTTTVAGTNSRYVRLRGTNMPVSTPYETDADGNPLSDFFTNAQTPANLTIPCTTTGTVPGVTTRSPVTGLITACPSHLPVKSGVAYVAYDVAAWSDLWFYSNPIYIELATSAGGVAVAGVN